MPTTVNDTPNRNAEMVTPDLRATLLLWAWMNSVTLQLRPGITTTITTAPLSGVGTPGTMTFVNGILTDSTPAT